MSEISDSRDKLTNLVNKYIATRVVCVISGCVKTYQAHQGIRGLMPETVDIATGLFVGPNLILTTIPAHGLAEQPFGNGFFRRTFFIERTGKVFRYANAVPVIADDYRSSVDYGTRLLIVANVKHSDISQYWENTFEGKGIILACWSGYIIGLMSRYSPMDPLKSIIPRRIDDSRFFLPPLEVTREESRSSFIFTQNGQLVGIVTGRVHEKMPMLLGIGGSVLKQVLFFNKDEEGEVKKIARSIRPLIL